MDDTAGTEGPRGGQADYDPQAEAVLAPLRRAVLVPATPCSPEESFGSYRLRHPLGQGAFGSVWEAEDSTAGKRLAIKVFVPQKFPNDEVLNAAVRFWQGAHSASHVPPSARVVAPVIGPAITGGRIWYGTRVFPEGDLWKRMKRGSLSVAQRLAIVSDLLGTIQVVHAAGVCHRDLRPDNILLATEDGTLRPYLADFDVAYYDHVFKIRRSTIVPLGMPRYLPPEVFGKGLDRDERHLKDPGLDLYGLTVIAFELFAGLEVPLSDGRAAADIEIALAAAADPVPAALRGPLARFCAAGMALDRRFRFKDAEEMARAWRRVTAPRWAHGALAVGLVGTVTGALVCADWLSFSASLSEGSRIIHQALGFVMAALSAFGGVAWLKTSLSGKVPRWRAAITKAILGNPKLSIALVALSALLPILVAGITDLYGRTHSYRVLTDVDCQARDDSGTLLTSFVAGQSIVRQLSPIPSVIECPNAEPRILPLSLLAPPIRAAAKKTSFEAPKALTPDVVADRLRSGTLRALDLVVTDRARYLLAAEQVSEEFVRNPDGNRSYEHAIYIIKVAFGGNDPTTLIHRVTELPMLRPDRNQIGAITLLGDRVIAFLNYKIGDANYAMAGVRFELASADLRSIRNEPLFGDAAKKTNWGFMPYFDGMTVVHFSYSDYYVVRDATPGPPIQPAAMMTRRESWQREHSGTLFPTDQTSLAGALFSVAKVSEAHSSPGDGEGRSAVATEPRPNLPTALPQIQTVKATSVARPRPRGQATTE